MGTRLDDFLTFAINTEVEAAKLYERYAGVVQLSAQRELLQSLAAMERGHESKLRAYLAGDHSVLNRIVDQKDLHISDYMVDIELSADSSIEEVFIFAMKAEQKAFDLYDMLSRLEEDAEARDLFAALAADEKRHKFDLESDYEKNFMKEF